MKISQCGKRVFEHHQTITNGFSAREGDWPWHSAIYHTDRSYQNQAYKCGGTLITPTAIVTAAHCLYDGGAEIVPERVVVHVGRYNLATSGKNAQQFQARLIVVHADYTPERFLDDIGIIRLSTVAQITAYVKPICLWDSRRTELSEVVNRNGIVVGFGLDETDSVSKKLNQANMPIVPVIDCLTSNPSFFAGLISYRTFCAGFRNGK